MTNAESALWSVRQAVDVLVSSGCRPTEEERIRIHTALCRDFPMVVDEYKRLQAAPGWPVEAGRELPRLVGVGADSFTLVWYGFLIRVDPAAALVEVDDINPAPAEGTTA